MEIKYDDISIDIEDSIYHLEEYAKAVLKKMQAADSEFSSAWTACVITFDSLYPEFSFGSSEDLDPDDGIYVEVKIHS